MNYEKTCKKKIMHHKNGNTEKNRHFCVSPFLGVRGGYKSRSLDQFDIKKESNMLYKKMNGKFKFTV